MEACNEVADSLQSRLNNYEKKVVPECESELTKQKEIEENLNLQVEAKEISLGMCERNETKQQRKITGLKILRNILIAVVGVEAGYIGFKSIFKN